MRLRRRSRGPRTPFPQFADTSLWADGISTSCHMLQRQKIHRAGCAFVRLSRELSAFRLAASAYSPQERLRPTRAPCSVQGETYALGRGPTRRARGGKQRSLRIDPGEILWISRAAHESAGGSSLELRAWGSADHHSTFRGPGTFPRQLSITSITVRARRNPESGGLGLPMHG